ncbi:MAG TPA: ATP-binding protein [Actinomycetes bacterium]|jgi:two-component system sensor histidine kinase KdpD|nr:ATP-binding protein [Actinomycetes bacterium]
MDATTPKRRAAGYAVATAGTVALSLVLLAFRDDTTPLSKGFGLLVVVVAAAAVGGLGPGILASVLGFLLFNFLFLPPYGTFVISRGEDVVVLFVFLGLSVLISALLARATERAEAAEAREQELRTLQTLSAELVALVPGPGSYQAILSRLLGLFGFAAGALYLWDPEHDELREQVTVGADPGAGTGPPERLPLSVGGRSLGVLQLSGDRRPLEAAERRVLRAFCDQFALVLERDELLHAATEAEAYRRTDQIRRSLLAAVSHDLRSPLAAIKASVTDLLGQDVRHGADDVRDALDSIDKEANRLAALIANLLDMSRIEGGMLQARPRNVDLAEVLGPCVDRLQREWPRLTVRLDVEADCVARADPVFLDRVVANLLDNAAKAATGGGNPRVEVRAGRADGRASVRVVDHGSGVPPSVREQLFYPFYQLDERHPRLGTGLGLAISKGFLTLMQGQIWIEETPGGGATFAFSLPNGGTER